MNDWDVSMVTNFRNLFSGMALFNEDISNWDVSSGENFVSACDVVMMLVQPSHGQEDPLLWPWCMLTWLPLLLPASTLRVGCFN